jgi:hypothetical protein
MATGGSLRLRRSWKLWKPNRRQKRYAAFRYHARELMLAPLRLRPEWALARLAPLEGTLPGAAGRLIAFIGCDPVYLEQHVPALAHSIASSSPETSVHLHVYHPDERDHARVDALRAELPLRVSATWDAHRLDGHSRRQQITYYESARFIRFAQVHERAELPMVSIDADGIVRAPLTRVLDEAGDVDAGLVLRSERADSAVNVLAATVLAHPTAGARLFLREVARRIARQLVSIPNAGFVDQRCLWFAHRKLRKRVRFAAIHERFSDQRMAADAIVWHAKGERTLPGKGSGRR